MSVIRKLFTFSNLIDDHQKWSSLWYAFYDARFLAAMAKIDYGQCAPALIVLSFQLLLCFVLLYPNSSEDIKLKAHIQIFLLQEFSIQKETTDIA